MRLHDVEHAQASPKRPNHSLTGGKRRKPLPSQVPAAKVQLSSRMSRLCRTRAVSSNEIRRVANVFNSRQDILERDGRILLAPAKRSRQALVFCRNDVSCLLGPSNSEVAVRKVRYHTEKVLHQRPIRCTSFRVAKRDNRRCQLAQTELLHGCGKSVGWVESAGVDLAEEFAVGELFGGQDAGGPELFGGGEGRWVEEVVVAVVGVHAAGEGGVLVCLLSFQGCMCFLSRAYLRLASCSRTLWRLSWSLGEGWSVLFVVKSRVGLDDLQREPGGIGVRVGWKSHLEHRLRQRCVEVEAILQSLDHDVFGKV